MLREIVDSARALTGRRYGVVTIGHERDRPHRFPSSGRAPDGHRQLAEWADGPRLFEHLRELPRPLRVGDSPRLRPVGLSPLVLRCRILQGTPIRHRRMQVGSLSLTGQAGGREFMIQHEEFLVLFASRAGAASANAWAYRDERRARANLEAFVDTEPVGMVTFDARTGEPLMLSREAKRIVQGLRIRGRPVEQLLKVMTVRLDGVRCRGLGSRPSAPPPSRSR